MAYAHRPALMTVDLLEGDALQALKTTKRSLEALNWMLLQSIGNESREPEIMSVYAEGLYDLIEMQTDVLTGVEEKIARLIDEKDELLNILQKQEPEPAGALISSVHDLRAKIIAEKTREGLSVSLIGRALGMNNDAVERVIQRLKGDDARKLKRTAND